MNHFLNEVAEDLNINWAWEKVRRAVQTSDDWYDEIALADFELELDKNLGNIKLDFLKNRYRLTPLKPIPYPKSADKDGNLRLRQMFKFAVRDQVAWLAIVNVIGPHIDVLMPTWSYGNRLYRTIWIEEDSSGRKLKKIGNYRHVSGHIYLPFRQSWPVFRRHVYLTTRAMMHDVSSDLDEEEAEELETQRQLDTRYQCPYIFHEYWKDKNSDTAKDLYWCSIDLEKFYPSIKIDRVRENIVENLPTAWASDADNLLKRLTNFKLDLKSWSNDDLKYIGLNSNRKSFPHIPTGLYVAGFLANAGMLSIDLKIQNHLKSSKIAHFRFVDDHILIAYDFDVLIEWIENYEKILKKDHAGIKINPEKVEPQKLRDFLTSRKAKNSTKNNKFIEAHDDCILDPKFPSPLMTKTIALVSGIARTNFNLLDSNEITDLSAQLEILLLVNLPEEEIPEKTRSSFAAMRLAMLAEHRLSRNKDLSSLNVQLENLMLEKRALEKTDKNNNDLEKIEETIREIKQSISDENKKIYKECKRTFGLLRKVLRERPELIRVWNRAALMCRMTGVEGISLLWEDLVNAKRIIPLTKEYLQANFLRLLAGQLIHAARIIVNPDTPDWRIEASKMFLDEIFKFSSRLKDIQRTYSNRKMLPQSLKMFLLGQLCSKLIIDIDSTEDIEKLFERTNIKDSFFEPIDYETATWAWWAARKTLGDLEPQAASFVKTLGKCLMPSMRMAAFWRFFPLDIPIDKVTEIANVGLDAPEGWWFDVLRKHTDTSKDKLEDINNRKIKKVSRAILSKKKKSISLYEWCDFVCKSVEKNILVLLQISWRN